MISHRRRYGVARVWPLLFSWLLLVLAAFAVPMAQIGWRFAVVDGLVHAALWVAAWMLLGITAAGIAAKSAWAGALQSPWRHGSSVACLTSVLLLPSILANHIAWSLASDWFAWALYVGLIALGPSLQLGAQVLMARRRMKIPCLKYSLVFLLVFAVGIGAIISLFVQLAVHDCVHHTVMAVENGLYYLWGWVTSLF